MHRRNERCAVAILRKGIVEDGRYEKVGDSRAVEIDRRRELYRASGRLSIQELLVAPFGDEPEAGYTIVTIILRSLLELTAREASTCLLRIWPPISAKARRTNNLASKPYIGKLHI